MVSFRRSSHRAHTSLRFVAACVVVVVAVAGLLGASHIDLAEAPLAFTLLPPTGDPAPAVASVRALPVACAICPAAPRGPPQFPFAMA